MTPLWQKINNFVSKCVIKHKNIFRKNIATLYHSLAHQKMTLTTSMPMETESSLGMNGNLSMDKWLFSQYRWKFNVNWIRKSFHLTSICNSISNIEIKTCKHKSLYSSQFYQLIGRDVERSEDKRRHGRSSFYCGLLLLLVWP